MTVIGALSYAELAAMMPKAGGQYVFLREGLSPAAGFLYGWTLFAVIQTGTIAAVAVAFARFLSVLVPGISPDVFLPLGQLRLPGAPDAIQLGLSPQRIVAILSICSSRRSTSAVSGSARRFRRYSAWPRSARSRCW